jgi:MATE family multidrug resistance protein
MNTDLQAGSLTRHVRETLVLASPLAVALLTEMAMGLISTLMLGGIGDRALAAGGLGANFFFTALIVLQGVLSGVGVLAASALGAGSVATVPRGYWSGVTLAVLLSWPLFALMSAPGPLLQALGEPPVLVADVAAYMGVLRWGVPAGVVGIGMMRQFLPAVGLQHLLLWVLPVGLVLHLVLNLVLVRGVFGHGGYGLPGSAAATVATLWAMALGMLAILHGGRFHPYVRPTMPSLGMLRALLALGIPAGLQVFVEAALFLATGIVAGRLGPLVLAAHMIALSVCTVCFMVPLAISQAANVRVATFEGARNLRAARRAGFCAIGLAAGFMAVMATVLQVAPHVIVALYLGGLTAANAATAALAARLLGVAGFFQIFDGTQVAATGALRGLQDVRVPMVVGALGYWLVGFCLGWFLAFHERMGAPGLWWGLCAGLAAVAVGLVIRFARRSGGQGVVF